MLVELCHRFGEISCDFLILVFLIDPARNFHNSSASQKNGKMEYLSLCANSLGFSDLNLKERKTWSILLEFPWIKQSFHLKPKKLDWYRLCCTEYWIIWFSSTPSVVHRWGKFVKYLLQLEKKAAKQWEVRLLKSFAKSQLEVFYACWI